LILILLGLVALVVGALLYFAGMMWWAGRLGRGVRYFGLPIARRRALRRRMALLGRPMVPIARLIKRLAPDFDLSFRYRGVAGPKQIASPKSFERCVKYQPDESDVFVATQMKCGTTWMQQVVYEVLSKGHGDLSDAGHRHMYALSPWIESFQSVYLDDAPRVGERQQRIIKTHMPVQLTPYSEQARYIYVLRHPVACFASCVDFMRMLAGPLAPDMPGMVEWFCTDQMLWSPWPEHAEGWWRQAQERPNVLFVHYEEMLEDLPAIVSKVAEFLDTPLSKEELARVVERSGFAYMKEHEDLFEMTPPTPFSHRGTYMKGGEKSKRDRDVGEQERKAILAFCRERLKDASYPAARYYPELG
jgi:hypothetical protein